MVAIGLVESGFLLDLVGQPAARMICLAILPTVDESACSAIRFIGIPARYCAAHSYRRSIAVLPARRRFRSEPKLLLLGPRGRSFQTISSSTPNLTQFSPSCRNLSRCIAHAISAAFFQSSGDWFRRSKSGAWNGRGDML